MGGHPRIQQHMLPIADAAPPDDRPPPLLLVDGHNLLWGATFGFPAPIYSRDKTRTLTGLFAFFALLRVAVRNEVPGGRPEIIVVFDGEHGSTARKAEHDGYKANRPTDAAALEPLQYLPDVRRGLDNHGIKWIEIDHEEADDVIATLVAATPPPRPVLIMSRDRDYYQLVTERVLVLNTRFRAGKRHVDPAQVYERHQVTPAQWADFRALAGDPADEIPGIPGIGAKTAATLLTDGLTLDDLPQSGRLTTGRGRTVAAQLDIAIKWRTMIRLNPTVALPLIPTAIPSPALPAPAQIVEELGLW
ncbi:5'-3' exonuclease H3TH domain-containing protein [Solwaraspora sp. WMMD1047]|uniref:5'-3' exonuclease n=1 Tax=Solwaraspora sp. WMMD1047 TaxID=3016102 RepID=UPI002417DD31|nr:5'-3' exonuclease H3TH domain-containing protein [Solwaraspora sp. WMMD1047]MDG4830014.1 5'-3' exonuclease H3TH domain-containing protein [Solwaraspora sp. WMMD1047]